MTYAVAVIPNGAGRLRWLVPGRDYRLPRSDGPLTLLTCFEDYVREHCIVTGGDPERAWIAFRAWINALGCDRDCATLTRADGRTVVEHELARGVSSATARKHLTMGLAALNHAKKEERITKVPKFQSPPAAQPRLRWLTRQEHRKLMLLPKPGARQLFWLLAFATGARTGAMLDLEWTRVDLVRRTIDYRVPGAVYKNKRRACVPINDALLPRLESAYGRRDTSCPFVVSRKGKRYSQGSLYHECKRDLANIGINERGVARHVARHTVASWILQDGGSILDVAKILGDTVSMVETVYGHMEPKHLMGAANLL
jgi:integrase